MAGTLPNGVNIESGGALGGGPKYGGGAAGGMDPQFTEHWVYMPHQGPPGAIPTQDDIHSGAASPADIHRYGGVGPPPGYGAGIGGGSGGAASAIASFAAGAGAGAMTFGAGLAAQIAAQEIQRAIQYGGAMAGVGVSGLMETFLPAGASKLASANWLTRIGGGLMGATANIPNVAGQPPSGPTAEGTLKTAESVLPGAGQQPGAGGGTNIHNQNTGVHIENYRVESTEDKAGKDLARHYVNMHNSDSVTGGR
jgi:hypothetical protein